MFGQSLLSGAFGTALVVPGENFGIGEYLGNGATNTLGGKIKGAALFNGSNTGMVVPGNMGTLLGNEFSISFWFYAPTTFPSSNYPTFASLYGYPGYGSAYGWSIEYPNSGKIMFYWVSSSAVGNNIQSSTLTPGEWCHVICTKDSNSANIYINNVLDNGSTAVSSNAMWYNGFEHFTVGCKQNTGAGGATSSHLSDSMDQLRIFTSVLTSAERAAVYAEDSSTANTLNFPTGAGCVAAYQFDNNVNGPLNTDKISTCDFPYGAGCQALYQFNDTSNDTCGTYNGTANNITYVNGVFNKAASFNGSSSYIDTNYTLPAVATISFSLWFKTTTTGSQMFLFGDFDSSGGNSSGRVSLSIESSNNFGIRTGDGSSYFTDNTTASASSYQNGNWHHAVLTANGTALKLYIDGSLLASITSSVAVGTAGAQSTTLGRLGDYSSSYFNGQLDQVRIFTSTLTQSQVTELARGAGSAKNAQDLNNNIAFNGFLNFKPDFSWIKRTSSAEPHALYDSIRGANEQLSSDSDLAQATNTAPYEGLTSFDPYGFSLGSNGGVNGSSQSYVAWNWKAGGAAVSNTDGSITSQVSANTDAGFSIVKYSPNDTVGMTVGHGLKKSPELVITKRLDSSQDWGVYTNVSTGNTTTNWLSLNDTDAYGAGSFMTLNPTTLELPQTGAFWSTASSNQIAYCWHSVSKYSKIGTYSGNGSTTGPIVSTGFEPSFVMIKETSSAGRYWVIKDNKRNPINPRTSTLYPNDSSAEQEDNSVNFLTDGFQPVSTASDTNNATGQYIFLAIA